LDRFWTSRSASTLALTTVGPTPTLLRSDGADVWTTHSDGTVSRVRASDGRLLETWTGAASVYAVLIAMGKVFAAGGSPGALYRIDPAQPAAIGMTAVATNLGDDPRGLAFDGARIWTANNPAVSIVTPGASLPWTVTTLSAGFSSLKGALYDGGNVWVVAYGLSALLKLDSAGAILQTVTVGQHPEQAVFDGANIWVPSLDFSDVTVVRAATGAVVQTLTGNGLSLPFAAAFDGERVLVTNATGNNVSLWKAADLTPLGSFPMPLGSGPIGACSDGVNFWIALGTAGKIARF
jgi:DNA-binding beta-propeller fold protein YncE